MNEPQFAEEEPAGAGPLWGFLGALILLALIKTGLGFVAIPFSLLTITEGLVTVLFIGIPVYALYRAASYRWTWKLAVSLILGGLLVHVGLQLLGGTVLRGHGVGGALLLSLRDVGFFTWCVGLGALLTTMLKDQKLLVPVSLFLIGLDIFLVLTPIGPVRQILERAPEIPAAVALNLPKVSSTAGGGAAAPFAIIGPADFVFMAMFFIALFKFGLNARATAIALVPAILVYLVLALFIGSVPLLVPIGLTVLAVNLKSFKMNTEEWASTALVVVLVAGLIWWGATRPAPPPEPLRPASGQGAPESGGSPSPNGPTSR